MKSQLAGLNFFRNLLDETDKATVRAEIMLEATPEYQNLQQLKEKGMEYLTKAGELSDSIKEDTVKEFISSGLENTKPYDGIQIKKFQVVHVLDDREAIEWAGTNAPQVLSLKKAPFNKIAKVLDLSFVEINTEYRAQIASDLSMYEDSEEE